MNAVDPDIIMFVENIFETRIPDDDAEQLGGELDMEEWLEKNLSNQRPKQDTATLLRMLAEAQQRPQLVQGLNGNWRREQISVLVRDKFQKRNSPIKLHEMSLLPRLRRFAKRVLAEGA